MIQDFTANPVLTIQSSFQASEFFHSLTATSLACTVLLTSETSETFVYFRFEARLSLESLYSALEISNLT